MVILGCGGGGGTRKTCITKKGKKSDYLQTCQQKKLYNKPIKQSTEDTQGIKM